MKFKEFPVYKDAKTTVQLIFRATRRFPREFYYLSDQMNRAGLSIILNIAEGSAKNSNKDFQRYLKNSLGSATEVMAALDVAQDFNLINQHDHNELIKILERVIKQLGGFTKFLNKN